MCIHVSIETTQQQYSIVGVGERERERITATANKRILVKSITYSMYQYIPAFDANYFECVVEVHQCEICSCRL